MSFDWSAYRESLTAPESEPAWEDAADLSRLSLDAFRAEHSLVRRDVSRGFVRLVGDGVMGHTASLDSVAQVMRHFQRLVLATGLSLSGFKSLQGRLPEEVVSRTRLLLDGSAVPGSLILQMVPATQPAAEIMPTGQADFFADPEDQLVDQALDASLELLNSSKEVGPDADQSLFLPKLSEAGPRVASTLKDLSTALVSAEFETEIVWEQPRRPRRTSRLSTTDLVRITKLVASRELEKEPTVLKGVLRTVSDISPLRLDLGDNRIESIDAKGLPGEEISRLLVGMQVRVEATVTEEVSAAGDARAHYAATAIRVVGDL